MSSRCIFIYIVTDMLIGMKVFGRIIRELGTLSGLCVYRNCQQPCANSGLFSLVRSEIIPVYFLRE